MNERNFIYLIVFEVIVLELSNGTSELITDETKARLFAQHASDKFFNTIDTIETEMSHENSNSDAEMLFQNISTIAANIFEETKKFDFKNFNDKNLKFIFESIRDCVGEFVIGQERSYEIFYTIYQLTNLSKSHDIKEYHDGSIDVKYDPDVKNIIKSTNDTDELEYYWTEWRKISGAWADNHLHTLVEGLQEAAKFRGNVVLFDFINIKGCK
ncbi:angiotensin-converting enzyme-like [Episyrphus balteatus]|uniref:angiotensin-converting enzyme-like n=1 Tax=Episyrphus balteatus TaxID=286459 RepID=UPI00248615B0|nr:angiotensin-converting enzyme-like [Episyrphus balteatus]